MDEEISKIITGKAQRLQDKRAFPEHQKLRLNKGDR
jgi:hypothetical protein